MALVATNAPEKPTFQHHDNEKPSDDASSEDRQDALAQLAALEEHKKTFWQALKDERRSVFWSVAVSSAVIMEGYDIVLVTSLFAQPAFSERFGTYSAASNDYQLDASWQAALGIAPMIGAIAGAFLNGWLSLRFGYRNVLLVSLLFMTLFVFILFFATNTATLLAGLILCGIPWGVFATLAPAYASEVCSLTLRGHLTVYVNLCWLIGQLIAAGVLSGVSTMTGEWAYRIPLALQWVFPLPLVAVLWFAPESPWWLLRKGRVDDAMHALQRLSSKERSANVRETLALIQHTNEIEDESQSGATYLDCFRGINLRRTEIICLVWSAQIWCGSPLGASPAYFFIQAGVPTSNAFYFAVGGLGLACVGTFISWFLITRFGRRTLYVGGLAALMVLLFIVGIAASISRGPASSYTQAGFILAWLTTYNLTVGPVCYAIVAELSAVRLRNKSVCVARIAFYLSQIIGNTIEPYMVNPRAGDWHGKTGYFWAGTCAALFLWAWFRLPESRDRSYEELEILFEGRVAARKFARVQVDPYAPQGGRIKEL